MASEIYKLIRGAGIQRKMKYIVSFTAAFVLLTATVAHGQYFVNSGKSARAIGMGETFLASGSDALGYWYNPAAVASFKNKQIGFGYGKPISNISDLMNSQINFVTPLSENSGLGIGIAYEGISESSDMVLSGAYGISMGNFSLGGNVKIMRWSAEGQKLIDRAGYDEDLSKTSFSLDLSANYNMGQLMGLDNFLTGVYVKDAIMPNISESGDDGGKLPVELGLGFLAKKGGLGIAGDVAYLDGATYFKAGAESDIAGSNLKVRGGFIYGSDFEDDAEKIDFDLGLGYSFSTLCFDYAYNIPVGLKESGGRHYFSFGLNF